MSAEWVERLEDLAVRYLAGEPVEEELFSAGRIMVRARIRMYGWYLPGATEEDLIQEGLIGFWMALRDWRPERGMSFRWFADMCITRHIITAVKTATRQKHAPMNEAASLDEPAPCSDRRPITYADLLTSPLGNPERYVIQLEELEEARLLILGLCQGMSRLERESLLRITGGQTYAQVAQALGTTVKAVDNAIQRARLKLRRRREAMSA
ncbi:sigma-70 family RNA polymerase sigma factor [Symbiobacterium terraclitae]|uniref:sigma-70 family RNA polymerase sigma factor n=1 Tax=Symbiobacterium terraclitae TaxID=557451 RepID=UPI0035B53021